MKQIRFYTLKRWIIILISPILWTTCFVLVYSLDEAACGLEAWSPFSFLVPLMLTLIFLTLVVNIANLVWGWRMWRSARENTADEHEYERDRFIGFSGILMGGLFAFMTIGLFGSVLALNPC